VAGASVHGTEPPRTTRTRYGAPAPAPAEPTDGCLGVLQRLVLWPVLALFQPLWLPRGLAGDGFRTMLWPLQKLQWLLPFHHASLCGYGAGDAIAVGAAALAFLYAIATGAATSVEDTGGVAGVALDASIILATRNSLAANFLGLPMERALRYHKFATVVATVLGICA